MKNFAFLFLMLLSACNSMFFYPVKEQIVDPDKIGIKYQVKKIDDGDGPVLNAWLLPAEGEVKGTILHLHGNAENISTHVGSVYWLPKYGFNVFTFDYRGYGASEGTTTLDGVQEDALRALKFIQRDENLKSKPFFLLGQSLGGAVGIYLAAREEAKNAFTAVIIESPFKSYRRITRDKLSDFWLTFLFNYPLSIAISSKYDPIDVVGRISPTPLLLIHTEKDEVIGPYHSEDLFEKAGEPKQFWKVPDAYHIQTFRYQTYQNKLVEYLNYSCE